jgi:hypothetical protein
LLIKEIPKKADNNNAIKCIKIIIKKEFSAMPDKSAASFRNLETQRYQTKAFATKIAFIEAFLESEPSIFLNLLRGIFIA